MNLSFFKKKEISVKPTDSFFEENILVVFAFDKEEFRFIEELADKEGIKALDLVMDVLMGNYKIEWDNKITQPRIRNTKTTIVEKNSYFFFKEKEPSIIEIAMDEANKVMDNLAPNQLIRMLSFSLKTFSSMKKLADRENITVGDLIINVLRGYYGLVWR